jgi:hypothetical protein
LDFSNFSSNFAKDKPLKNKIMQTNDILIIQPRTMERLNALKVFLSTFNLDFVVEKPYNQEFVKKIHKSKQEFETGDFKSVQQQDLQAFLGL